MSNAAAAAGISSHDPRSSPSLGAGGCGGGGGGAASCMYTYVNAYV